MKHVRPALPIAALILMTVALLSCGSGGNSRYADILGARALAIVPTADGKGTENVLYKVTVGNQLVEVPIDVVSQPVGLFNVNQLYVIVTFGSNIWNPDHGYILRKADGAIFSLEAIGYPYLTYDGDTPVKDDSSGAIYIRVPNYGNCPYGSCNSEIYKVTEVDEFTLSGILCTPSMDDVKDFAVSGNGTIAYAAWDGANYLSRLRFPNGSLKNIPSVSSSYPYAPGRFFIDFDSTLYYHNVGTYHFVSVNDNDLGSVTYADYVTHRDFSSSYYVEMPAVGVIYKVDQSLGGFHEVYNHAYTSTDETYSTNFNTTLTTTKCAVASDKFIYVSGYDSSLNTVVLRFDPVTRSTSELLRTGSYDIHDMAASSSEVLTASALRLSDGRKVIIAVAGDGSIATIDDGHDAEPIALAGC